MAYITGLAQTTKTAAGIATVMGVISAESKYEFPTSPVAYELSITARHLSWVNSAVLALAGDPFVGPSDT